LAANNHRRKDTYAIPKADQELLKSLDYRKKLDAIDDAIVVNAKFVDKLVEDPTLFGETLAEKVEDFHISEHGHDHGAPGSSMPLLRGEVLSG
jgi:carnosine N-methyltransferase